MSDQKKRCSQCGKELAPDESREQTIIYRTSGWTRRGKWGQIVAEKDMTVCKDGPCGGHLQMAHEG